MIYKLPYLGRVDHMGTFSIDYNFKMPGAQVERFNLAIDNKTLELVPSPHTSLPDWSRLEFYQCANCCLSKATYPYCPLVANLVPIVQRFNNILSYDQLDLDVVTTERVISQHTTAQRGISALMGLIFATSGCPHTIFFKPMARFHLPLASEEETVYRAASMYLLAQYFRANQDLTPDYELDGLKKIYQNVQIVNIAVAKRLRAATTTDSAINAITLLDIYAKGMPFRIKDSLEDLRYLFKPFLQGAPVADSAAAS